MKELTLIARARAHDKSTAFRSGDQQRDYGELLQESARVAVALLDCLLETGRIDGRDLQESRIAYLVPGGFDYTAVQWGIWRSGGVAMPLSLSATESELEYALLDSQSACVIASRDQSAKVAALCQKLGLRLLLVQEIRSYEEIESQRGEAELPEVAVDRRAMILYTSGTTSKPKGVVTTHATIQAQIETLVNAWQWQPTDYIPLFLPLHHIHGIINVMSCALWSGATIEPFARFEIDTILNRVADGAYTVFMAVPTIYVKLIEAIESLGDPRRRSVIGGFAEMRLMVSGSAALPASIHEHWTALTGQRLLERYGMTEIGMALSNPYDGDRMPGKVGQPLPGVQIRLKNDDGEIVTADGQPGEIQVRGPNVFCEYFGRQQATAESFDDGWFRSGDVAVVEQGYYRIMGRQSVDIIKSGGYKLSALEIEAALLDHPDITQCAVVGLPDETWGEIVAVAAVLAEGRTIQLEGLRTWCDGRVSKYKMPKRLLIVDSLPRNAMGKVTKGAVAELF
ncbi:MAG: AMP-binding protein [Pirellulaceae bacterium]|nr:AMP-binding protein [Pirellulaceae bacterium]